MSGRSRDPKYGKVVQEALLCKLFSCRPSELRQEDWDDVLLYSIAFQELAKKNPMALLM